MKYTELLNRMTIEEKINLCCGADFWRSVAFEQYGIPAMVVADGPHGLRAQHESGDMLGIHSSAPATCFPTAAAMGCSWDRELIGEIARAITREALSYGVDTVLGPGLNIKRSPLCGRNFEYFSEDPYLSGQLGAAYVKQGQQDGIGTCLKHFAANSQEYKRFSSDDHIDERTLREIYLPAFEQAVIEGQPAMVMCAYNKINGTYCSDNKWLLTDVLRGEWGFEGMVVTDWGAMHDRVAGFKSGCDWSMPGGTTHLQRKAQKAYDEGTLTEREINACADRILTRVFEAAKTRKHKQAFDQELHHSLARRASAESAVLLKNDGLLPLKTNNVALIGRMAKTPRYQGSGSSHINPTRLESPCDAAPHWVFAPGCDARGGITQALLDEAVKTAKSASVAVVVTGLTDHYESEGFDREDMCMPQGHINLIEAVAAANPNTVVVLCCGSPVEIPWIDKVRAVLYMGLPGQAGGAAMYDVLTGKANPGGKLAETWPLRGEDTPCAAYYEKPYRDAQYREGIYVGYRYYETAAVPVRFAFGHGLSYTKFTYSDMQITDRTVSVVITNTGDVAGAEIVQLYIAPPQEGLHRPAKELKGFAKRFLQPSESRRIEFTLNERSFALWDGAWKVQRGTYGIHLGSGLHDIRLSAMMEHEGTDIPAPAWQAGSWYAAPQGTPGKEDLALLLGRAVPEEQCPQKGRFTDENTIVEMAEHSWMLRIVKYFMGKAIANMDGKKVPEDDPVYRMAMSSSADCALFGLVISSTGSMPESVAYGLLEIANGHFFKGLRRMCKKV